MSLLGYGASAGGYSNGGGGAKANKPGKKPGKVFFVFWGEMHKNFSIFSILLCHHTISEHPAETFG